MDLGGFEVWGVWLGWVDHLKQDKEEEANFGSWELRTIGACGEKDVGAERTGSPDLFWS